MTEQNLLIRPGNSVKNSGFFEKLGELMENETFRGFINDYFSTWDDSKASTMLLQHYILIDDEYYRRTGRHLETSQIVNIMKEIVMNGKCRQLMVTSINKFFEEGNQEIREIYEKGNMELKISGEI